MSTHAPHDESPLPTRAREDLTAFRSVKPSDDLMARVQSALAAAEKRGPSPSPDDREPPRESDHRSFLGGTVLSHEEFSKRRRARWTGAGGMAVVAAAAAGVFALKGGFRPHVSSGPAPVQMTVRLSAIGPTWVHLPARLHEHNGDDTTVHIDVPANQPHDAQVALGEADLPRTCLGALCSHRAVASADTGNAHASLRMRIHQPGRYEIRITHASHLHMQHDHFVVLATR